MNAHLLHQNTDGPNALGAQKMLLVRFAAIEKIPQQNEERGDSAGIRQAFV